MEIVDIDGDDPNYCVPLDSVCLGTACEEFSKDYLPDVVQPIRETWLELYRTAVKEMQERFSMDDSLLWNLKFLEPEVALQETPRAKIPNVSDITVYFEEYYSSGLKDEWLLFNDFQWRRKRKF